MDISASVDARGLIAPLPLVELKKAMDAAAAGEAVELIADLGGISGDVQRYAREAGHEVASQVADGDVLRFVLVRGG